MLKLVEDIVLIVDIFNNVWFENWGFLLFMEDEVKFMVDVMKLILKLDFLWIFFIDGELVSFILMILNLNEVMFGLDGWLLLFGWM